MLKKTEFTIEARFVVLMKCWSSWNGTEASKYNVSSAEAVEALLKLDLIGKDNFDQVEIIKAAKLPEELDWLIGDWLYDDDYLIESIMVIEYPEILAWKVEYE